MSKHTPGPWIFSSGAVDDSNGMSLLKSARSFDRTNYRDLHLAAAAPELLEQLQAILTRLDMEPVDSQFPCSAMREDIRTAIAKATG